MVKLFQIIILSCAFASMGCSQLHAQFTQGAVVKGFKVADEQKGRRKFFLNGKEAVSKGKDIWLIKEFRVENYGEDGKVALVVTAPECLYNNSNRVAISSGPLKAVTGDAKLALEGTGFIWTQLKNQLYISNQVVTVIQRPDSKQGTSPASSSRNTSTNQIIIHANTLALDLDNKSAIYEGNVTAGDLTTDILCDKISARLGANAGEVEEIRATGSVRITSKEDGSTTTGDQALYRTSAEKVDLEGNVRWVQGTRSGTAQKVSLDRKSKALAASGKVKVRLPRESMSIGISFASPTPTVPNQGSTTGRFIDVECQNLDSSTNRIVCSGEVVVIDTSESPAMTLKSAELIVQNSENGKPRFIDAAGGVSVIQSNHQIQSRTLRYEPAAAQVQFDDAVAWKWEEQEGTADHLTVGTAARSLHATGNAIMSFPLHAAGARTTPFLPFANPAGGTPSSNRFVRVHAREFQMESNKASFLGSVKVSAGEAQPGEDSLKCERLFLTFTSPSNRLDSLLAEDHLVLTAQGALNTPVAEIRGNRLIGSGLSGTNLNSRFEIDGGVQVGRGALSASGAKAVYTLADELIRLTGAPTAKTDEMRIDNASEIFWYWKENRFSATGKWRAEWLRNLAKTKATPNPGKP